MKEIYDWVPWYQELAKNVAEGGRRELIEKAKLVAWKDAGETPPLLRHGEDNIDPLRIPLKVTSQSRSKLPVNPVQKYHPIHGKVTAWAVADERSLGATRRGGGHYG